MPMAQKFHNSLNSEEFGSLALLDFSPLEITKPQRQVLAKSDHPERNESCFVEDRQQHLHSANLSIFEIFQFCVFATIFQSFAISSIFELDTSSFGFWALFHVDQTLFIHVAILTSTFKTNVKISSDLNPIIHRGSFYPILATQLQPSDSTNTLTASYSQHSQYFQVTP